MVTFRNGTFGVITDVFAICIGGRNNAGKKFIGKTEGDIGRDYQIQKNGFSPTVRELCKLVVLKSTSSMAAQLSNLRNSGHITWTESMPRTITVVEKGVAEA